MKKCIEMSVSPWNEKGCAPFRWWFPDGVNFDKKIEIFFDPTQFPRNTPQGWHFSESVTPEMFSCVHPWSLCFIDQKDFLLTSILHVHVVRRKITNLLIKDYSRKSVIHVKAPFHTVQGGSHEKFLRTLTCGNYYLFSIDLLGSYGKRKKDLLKPGA